MDNAHASWTAAPRPLHRRRGGSAIETIPSSVTHGGVKHDPRTQKQPLRQDPPLHMQVPLMPSVLMTAFSYEQQAGLLPVLPTVPAEAEHIAVRSCHHDAQSTSAAQHNNNEH